MSNMISKEDVLSVANSLKVSLTEKQINDVIEMYPTAEEVDPTGTWDLLVENCIYLIAD